MRNTLKIKVAIRVFCGIPIALIIMALNMTTDMESLAELCNDIVRDTEKKFVGLTANMKPNSSINFSEFDNIIECAFRLNVEKQFDCCLCHGMDSGTQVVYRCAHFLCKECVKSRKYEQVCKLCEAECREPFKRYKRIRKSILYTGRVLPVSFVLDTWQLDDEEDSKPEKRIKVDEPAWITNALANDIVYNYGNEIYNVLDWVLLASPVTNHQIEMAGQFMIDIFNNPRDKRLTQELIAKGKPKKNWIERTIVLVQYNSVKKNEVRCLRDVYFANRRHIRNLFVAKYTTKGKVNWKRVRLLCNELDAVCGF